jgi:hypothetical protein
MNAVGVGGLIAEVYDDGVAHLSADQRAHDYEVFPLLWAFLLRDEVAIRVLSINGLFVNAADAVSCALDPNFLFCRERLADHHIHSARSVIPINLDGGDVISSNPSTG